MTASTKEVKAKVDAEVGYKAHRAGSRKGLVHRRFDEHSETLAKELGVQLGLKESTLRQWFRTWKKEAEATDKMNQTIKANQLKEAVKKATPARKPAAKKPAAKKAPAKKAPAKKTEAKTEA